MNFFSQICQNKPIQTMIKITFLSILLSCTALVFGQTNPILPEHPRPDFERSQWQNLNGDWEFAFDAKDQGEKEAWFKAGQKFNQSIKVPVPWGSALSGVKDDADIAW